MLNNGGRQLYSDSWLHVSAQEDLPHVPTTSIEQFLEHICFAKAIFHSDPW
jgi:hypothetical protein